MSRSVFASLVVSIVALGVAGASAISSGFSGVFQNQLATPQGTGFTFQGRIEADGVPHDGSCDLQFALYEDATGTTQVGGTDTLASPVAVTNGRFSALVNATGAFGVGAFDGDRRWLEVGVRCPAGSGSFTTLEPLTELTPVPYATFAMDSASLGGFPAEAYARYARVLIVNSGGTDAENGARLVAAMAEASAITPGRVLLLLEPGRFVLTAPLTVNATTDIAGIEGGVSTITNTSSQPTLQTVGGTVLSNLGISGGSGPGAVLEHTSGPLELNSVSLSATNAGFLLRSAAPSPNADITLNDSSFFATCISGTCIAVQGTGVSRFYFNDTDVYVGGISQANLVIAVQVASYMTVTGGNITASGRNGSLGAIAIDAAGSSPTISIEKAAVSATGAAGAGGGLTAIRSNHPLLVDQSSISANGHNGAFNFGIDTSSNVTLRDSRVLSHGGTQRMGLYLKDGGSHVIERTSIEVTGTDSGSPGIQQVDGVLTIRHSHIAAATASTPVFTQSGTATIVHSSLYGTPVGGSVICAATTDEATAFHVNTCPP